MSATAEMADSLAALRRGESGALERVLPQVYDELRQIARRQLRRSRPQATLDTTALVHEAYLRLARHGGAAPRDRGHLLAVAATAMRHVLVDAARRRAAGKRGGATPPATLEEDRFGRGSPVCQILAIDQALGGLDRVAPRLARLVELRFFAGLSVGETAEALEISERTVKRDWRKARAFLFEALSAGARAA